MPDCFLDTVVVAFSDNLVEDVEELPADDGVTVQGGLAGWGVVMGWSVVSGWQEAHLGGHQLPEELAAPLFEGANDDCPDMFLLDRALQDTQGFGDGVSLLQL